MHKQLVIIFKDYGDEVIEKLNITLQKNLLFYRILKLIF